MRIQLYFVGFPLFFGLSAFFSLFIGFSVRFRPFSPSCKLFSEKPFISRLFASTVENFGSFCFFRRFPLISFSSSGFRRISRNLRAFLRQSEVFYLFFRLQTFICRFPVFHGILADLHCFSAVRLVFVSFPTLQTDMQCFQANPLFVRMFRRFYSFHPLKHLATT